LEANHPIHPVGYMNLLADGVHNLIDGMIIGASYLVSLPVGIATTIAVIFHEIPHELGNFFILLYAGFTKTKALLFNFLTGLFAILGTLVALLVGSRWRISLRMLPLAAGGFIYIAGSDLVPELNKEVELSKSFVQLVAITTGVGLMLLLALVE
jgi:zinc and cadmium transporter